MQVTNLADASRLSPLQQGVLSHHLRHPKDGDDLVQLVLDLAGPLSPPALRQAWEQVVAHHQILRTSFRWDGLPAPIQLVQRRVELPWETSDRRGSAADIPRFLAEDRARRLNPAREPLLRLSLVETGPREHVLVLTYHPLILDRRSALLIAGQALTLYEAFLRGESCDLPPSRPFRDYVEWVCRQDMAEAERFWRRESARTAASEPPGSGPALPGKSEVRERALRLSPALTAALGALNRDKQLTAETLVQGACALLLGDPGRAEKGAEVVLGVTVEGADGGFAEPVVGPLSQTLPLRLAIAPEAPLLPWLTGLRDRQAAVRRYGYVPLGKVEEWSGARLPLHSRIVDETLPPPLERRPGAGVEVREVRLIEPLRHSFTLAVRSGPELAVRMIYDPERFAEAEIALRQERLEKLLESFAGNPLRPLRQLMQRQMPSPASPQPAPARRGAAASEIVPVPRDRPLPATYFQEWALQLEGAATNSIPCALSIVGRIDLEALRKSLLEIVHRHEALRTSFGWEDGEARLIIAPPGGMPLPMIDLAALAEPRRTEALNRLTAEYEDQSFDLARGPLFVAQVIRLGERQHILLMALHHLIADGWSLQVLQRDLFLVYKAFAEKRPSPLPPLPFQPADFSWWQRRVYVGESLDTHLAWWRQVLGNVPPPPVLPVDRPRPEIPSHRVLHATSELAPGPTQVLRAFALASKCSLPMVLFAALNALLHTYSGQEDLVISTVSAARNRRELSGLIGLFMNMVPVRTDLSSNPSFRDLVGRVRGMMVEAYARQEAPIPRVLAELFPGRTLTRTTLSGVCFNMLSFSAAQQPAGAARLGDNLSASSLPVGKESAKYDLVAFGRETEAELFLGLSGAADLFQQETLATMVERFKNVLIEGSKDPDIPMDRLKLKVARPAAYLL
jgi:hypothetical protein